MKLLFDIASHQGTLVVTLVIWIGLFLYLVRLDRRITELEETAGSSTAEAGRYAGSSGK